MRLALPGASSPRRGSGSSQGRCSGRRTTRGRHRRGRAGEGRRRAGRGPRRAAAAPGSAWPRSRCGCSTPTARSSCSARTGSAAPRRAAGGGCRRSSTARSSGWSPTGTDLWWPAGLPAADPVPAAAPWGRGAARARARPAGPGGGPARRGRGLVAGAARRVRRRHQGLGVRRARRVHRGARAAPGLRPGGIDGAVAGGSSWRSTRSPSPCSWSGRCGTPTAP